MTTHPHPLVADWFARLDRAAQVLPAARAAELRADLFEHVTAALGEGVTDDRRVVEVLDRLGDPEEVVAAEGGLTQAYLPTADPSGNAPGPAGRAVAAVVFLLASAVTGLFFPLAFVLWLVGVILFIPVAHWTPRTKLVGGWILIPVVFLWGVLGILALEFFGMVSRTCTSAPGRPEVCVDHGPAWLPWVSNAVAVLVLAWTIAAIVTAVVLIRRAQAAARTGVVGSAS